MSKRKYTTDWYKSALQGAKDKSAGDYQGLRKYATGFTAEDGYDLANFSNWTTSQKRKVREYTKVVQTLQARSNKVTRPKSEAKLRMAQEAGQHPPGFKQINVAFLPYTPAKSDPTAKVKVRYTKSGVVLKAKYYEKVLFAFNKKELAVNTESEIDRVIAEAKAQGYNHFAIATGEHQIASTYNGDRFKSEVIALMMRYDGKTNLPRYSGNIGDSASVHHWKHWLRGLIAYKFGGGGTRNRLLNDINYARAERRKERDRLRKRKGKP